MCLPESTITVEVNALTAPFIETVVRDRLDGGVPAEEFLFSLKKMLEQGLNAFGILERAIERFGRRVR